MESDGYPTNARNDPHLKFLILMDACSVNGHFLSESAKTEELWASMMVSGVADVCTTHLQKYPAAKMVRPSIAKRRACKLTRCRGWSPA